MAETNREFSESSQFRDLCLKAGLPMKPAMHKRGAKTVATSTNTLTRQASKYRRKTGIVYQTEHQK